MCPKWFLGYRNRVIGCACPKSQVVFTLIGGDGSAESGGRLIILENRVSTLSGAEVVVIRLIKLSFLAKTPCPRTAENSINYYIF